MGDGDARTVSFNAWRGFHSFPPSFSPSFNASLMSGVSPVASAIFTSATYATNLAALNSLATFSRAGLATQFDSSGYLTYGPNNLLTYSNTFSNAAWTKATMTVASGFTDPLGGSNATRLTATGATSYVLQSTTSSSGFNALTSIWVRRVSGSGTINLWTIGGSTGTAITPTSTWTQYSATGNAPTGVAYAGIIIQTSGDVIEVYAATASAVTYETTPRSSDQVITTSAAYYGPRFDYTYNGSSWVPAGLLVEGAATNNNRNSGALATELVNSNTTTTANSGTAPDGSNAFVLLAENASTSTHFAYPTTLAGAITSATTTTISVFAKAGTVGPLGINLQGAANNYASVVFNLSTGAVTQTSVGATSGTVNGSGVQNLGGGVYRIWAALTVTGASTPAIFMAPAASGNTFTTLGLVSYTGVGTNNVLVWGLQVETGAGPTSYTPTGASAVTRAAETVQLTGTALSTLQGASGTLIVETRDMKLGSTGFAAMVSANAAGLLPLYTDGTQIKTWNGTSILATASAPNIANPVRAGVAWSASGRSLTFNGGAVASDAGSYAPSLTSAVLGSQSPFPVSGHIASLAAYNSRLPDATLQAKSVVGAAY